MNTKTKLRLLALATAAIIPALGAGPAMASTLNGVLHIGAGSYIRMQLPSGGYFANPYSKDNNKTYTLIRSSKTGGITSGRAQKAPSPAFDSHGNSLATSIIEPTSFTGIDFGAITTVAPTFTLSGTKLTVSLRHLYAEWNKQSFLQGAIATGTYNAKNHSYVLNWHTIVKGGAFDGYTGWWHLQGTFSPS